MMQPGDAIEVEATIRGVRDVYTIRFCTWVKEVYENPSKPGEFIAVPAHDPKNRTFEGDQRPAWKKEFHAETGECGFLMRGRWVNLMNSPMKARAKGLGVRGPSVLIKECLRSRKSRGESEEVEQLSLLPPNEEPREKAEEIDDRSEEERERDTAAIKSWWSSFARA